MDWYSDRQSFIALKDHKDNFKSNTKCRLSSLAKSEMGKFSKKYLEAIISNANEILKHNQWKDTFTVIEWFKCIPNKRNCWFINFNIVKYYLSISADLLNKSINFAKYFVDIDHSIFTTIKHARKSLLLTKVDRGCKKMKTHSLKSSWAVLIV